MRVGSLALSVLATAALAACGDSGREAATTSTTPTTGASEPPTTGATEASTGTAPAPTTDEAPAQPAVRRVDPRSDGFIMGMGEWALAPEARAIRPGRVTFVIRNNGDAQHGFEIKAEGGGGDDRFEAQSRVLPPGRTTRITVDLPAGVYEIECYVAEHDALGMQGILVVRPDAPLVRERRGGGTTVEITGFAYQPPELTVSRGDTVTWMNRDAAPHTVTADGGAFDSGQFDRGRAYRRRFPDAGTFAYFCAIHPNMRGSVTVRE
jgi:plastocyanin